MSLTKRAPRSTKRRTSHHVAREVATEKLPIQAVELKVGGLTYRQIGVRLEVTHARAHQLVNEALATQRTESEKTLQRLRDLEDERLDLALQNIFPLLTTPDSLVVRTLNDGSEVREDAAEIRLKAIDRLIKVSQRRSELHGLNAPAKHALTDADGNSVLPALSPAVTAALESGYDEIVANANRPATS